MLASLVPFINCTIKYIGVLQDTARAPQPPTNRAQYEPARPICAQGSIFLAKKSSPSPLWGHRLPVTALGLSAHRLDKIISLTNFVSSVRTSNSHPDLLLTQQHPHFFRSQRSSTLDFHILSHYSYIKGNHWTHLLDTCIPHGYNRISLQDSAR